MFDFGGEETEIQREKQLQIRVHFPLEISYSEVLVWSWGKHVPENRSPLCSETLPCVILDAKCQHLFHQRTREIAFCLEEIHTQASVGTMRIAFWSLPPKKRCIISAPLLGGEEESSFCARHGTRVLATILNSLLTLVP